MDERVLAEAAALTHARQTFALATVVWRRAPSSGQVGSKAIILADGTVRGWLGGLLPLSLLVCAAIASLTTASATLRPWSVRKA